MRATNALLVFFVTACIAWIVQACDPSQSQNGCKVYGTTCKCAYGCKSEYIYKTRRACLNALRESSLNFCARTPCVRGICIQTMQSPGYTCKCEGTGYYGQLCERGLKQSSLNFCARTPCVRGICIQTMQSPGYTCKCEGTGYYGQRCEKACPTKAVYGVFPHECVVI